MNAKLHKNFARIMRGMTRKLFPFSVFSASFRGQRVFSMKFYFILICLVFAFSISAQELTPLEIAKKTIAASGGENWRRPKTLHLSGTAVLYWNNQIYRMNAPHSVIGHPINLIVPIFIGSSRFVLEQSDLSDDRLPNVARFSRRK